MKSSSLLLFKMLVAISMLHLSLIVHSQTSDWLSLDEGLCCPDSAACGPVYDIFIDSISGYIYASGIIGYDGNCNQIGGVVKWTGASWEVLQGNEPIALARLSMIQTSQGLLASGPYVINESGEETYYYTNMWDGASWQAMPDGPNKSVSEFELIDNKIYAAGKFDKCGGVDSGICCVYDGENWYPLVAVPEFSHFSTSVESYNDQIYIGGLFRFDNSQGDEIAFLTVQEEGEYKTVGQGLVNYGFGGVSALASYKGKLYIGGQIMLPGSDEEYWLVVYDGDTIQPVEPMPNDEVNNLEVYNGALYVTGGFTQIGDVGAEHLARFDGEEWIAINADSMFTANYYMGYQFTGAFEDLEFLNDTLYACGSFYRFNNDTVRGVAKLNKNLTTDFPPPATNTEEHEFESFNFNLYPNPSPGSLTFSWWQPAAGEVSYRITDARGRLVEHSPPVVYQSGKHEENLSLGHLTAGTYFIRLITPSGVATKPWVRLE
jgi:hypothetical protein